MVSMESDGQGVEIDHLPLVDELLEAYGRELYAYLWRLLQNRQDAEDCLQDTYLRAYKAFQRTHPDWNYRAWLYKIATNVARTYLKRSSRQTTQHKHVPTEHEIDPLEQVTHNEQVKRVLDEVAKLSFRQRTALMMRKYSGLDYELIADVLDCSPETARAHVYQGVKRLRERLVGELIHGEIDAK